MSCQLDGTSSHVKLSTITITIMIRTATTTSTTTTTNIFIKTSIACMLEEMTLASLASHLARSTPSRPLELLLFSKNGLALCSAAHVWKSIRPPLILQLRSATRTRRKNLFLSSFRILSIPFYSLLSCNLAFFHPINTFHHMCNDSPSTK